MRLVSCPSKADRSIALGTIAIAGFVSNMLLNVSAVYGAAFIESLSLLLGLLVCKNKISAYLFSLARAASLECVVVAFTFQTIALKLVLSVWHR